MRKELKVQAARTMMPDSRAQVSPSGKVTINGNDSVLDNLRWYYAAPDNVTLPEDQERIRIRLVHAQGLLLQFQTKKMVVKSLIEQFGISDKQAMRDHDMAVTLYGHLSRAEKEGYREIIYEMAHTIFLLAKKKDDYPTMLEALKEMRQIRGLDKVDPDTPDWDEVRKLQPVLLLDERLQAAFLQFMQQSDGVLDGNALGDALSRMSTPIEFEHIKEEDADGTAD